MKAIKKYYRSYQLIIETSHSPIHPVSYVKNNYVKMYKDIFIVTNSKINLEVLRVKI